MRLSELTTDQGLDVLCEISPYVNNIACDEGFFSAIGKGIKTDGMTKAGLMLAGAERLNKLIPILLQTHRKDIYGILGAINGVSKEEIAAQNVLKTAMQIRDALKDEELLGFFKSCAEQGPRP